MSGDQIWLGILPWVIELHCGLGPLLSYLCLVSGPHPNHASKYWIKKTLFVWKFGYINYEIIHHSISLLWRAGLVMCNTALPEYQAKYCIAHTRKQIWIQKGCLCLFNYFCISEYHMFVCVYFELWLTTYDLQISILLNFSNLAQPESGPGIR